MDPSRWNLGLSVVLMGACAPMIACGPVIPLGDTDAGTGSASAETSDTIDDATATSPSTTSPSTTSPSTTSPSTTSSTECVVDEDCPPNYRCDNGVCYYEGCADGCCYDDGCWYNECYYSSDCAPGYACQYNFCELLEPEAICESVPFGIGFDLPIPGGAASLAFVDADGDAARDLLVGGAGLTLARVDASTSLIDPASLPSALAVRDLDGDGDDDVALLDVQTGGPRVLYNDGAWSATDLPPVGTFTALALADTSGGGLPNVVATGAEGTFGWRNAGAGEWLAPAYLWEPSISLSSGNLDGDQFEDLAVFGYTAYALYGSESSNAVELYSGSYGGVRRIAVANFDGTGDPDVLLVESTGVGSVVRGWAGPVLSGTPASSRWWPHAVDVIAVADVNQDGFADVVGGGAGLSIAYGGAEADGIACIAEVATPISPLVVAVGDMSGDGRPDLAISDFNTVHVLLRTD